MTADVTYQDKPWLKHYQAGVPDVPEYEALCLPDFLDRSASRFPNKISFYFEGFKLTYAQLKDMVDRFATCLHEFGIRKDDAVAILLPNTITCVAAYYAIHRIGAVAVMNNPLYSDRELEHQLNDSGSKVLITVDLLANRMIDLRPKTKIKQIVYTSMGDYLPFPKNFLFPFVGKKKGLAADVKSAEDVYRWKDLIAETQPNPPTVKLTFDDVAMYQYTGGTTGVSKGAILTHGNLSKIVQQTAAWFPDVDENNVALGALPLFHVFGLSGVMNFGIYFGWTTILIPRPQPDQLIEAIKKTNPTFAALVPTMYIGILQHPEIGTIDLSTMNDMFSGSAPLPVEVIKEFENRTGGIIVEGYGLTESSPTTHCNPRGKGSLRKIGSIGIPISDTECRVVDVNDGKTDVPVGETGEIIIRGPQVMRGYLNRDEATAETLADGWLHTGDIGKMDEDGYFYIIDRKKDMVISGGYNIYPRDIEEIYYEHPKVMEATAIGIPHPTRGEAVKVFIVLKAGESATQEEMIAYCGDKLAKYKWPTEIEFRDELPKTNVGKILKKDLREQELQKRSKS